MGQWDYGNGGKGFGKAWQLNTIYCNYIQHYALNKPFWLEELRDKNAVTDLLMQGVVLAQATAGDNAKNGIRR